MRVLTARLCVVIAIVAAADVHADSAAPVGTRLVHESWTFKDGAPEVTTALAQTDDGYLWIGAPAGLFRFDGIRFELFHPAPGEHLLSTNVSSLLAADGGLWVGYVFGGFSYVKNGRVKNFDEVTGTVYGFARDARGVVWAAARGRRGDVGLWRFEGLSPQRVVPESGLAAKPVAQVGVDKDGVLWVLSGGRGPESAKDLYFLPRGERTFRRAAANFVAGGFANDADHRVLTTPQASDAVPADTSITWEGTLPAYPILTRHAEVFVDRADHVWSTSSDAQVAPIAGRSIAGALAAMSRANSEAYPVKAMLEARLVDREGSIWIGGETALHRFSYSPVVALPLPTSPSPFFMVVPDDDGAVWISANDSASHSALYRVTNGKLTQRALPGGVGGFAFRARDKTVWLGGEDGVWQIDKGVPRRVALPPETTNFLRFLVSGTQDASGTIWLSFAGGGLYRMKDGAWTKYQPARAGACPASGVVITFADSHGRLWLGCPRNQMAIIEDGRELAYGPKDGLAGGNVTAIHGRGDSVWIGGEFGLQRFEQGRFSTLQALDAEALRGISGIIETREGDLWLNGLGGIVHIRQSEIAAAVKNPDYRVNGERYDRHAGLPGLPSQLAQLPTAAIGTDGRLWFSVNNGVVSIDPENAVGRLPAPPVSIQSIVADDKAYDPEPSTSLPARTGSLQITYAAPSLLHPDAVRFRYRLEGIDDGWLDAGHATSVSYRSLPPGNYRFQVDATDLNGRWSDNVASAAFILPPAFYQTGWFRGICALLVLALAWLVYRMRIASIQQRFEMRLEARVGERTRIARELHDTLLQTFHGALSRFQAALVLLPNEPARAKDILRDAIDHAEGAITEGRDAVHDLRTSTSETNDLIAAIRGLAAEHSADVTVDGATRQLHPVVRDEIFRIANEALRNAARHANASQIAVEIRYDAREFSLSVRDDGSGMDPTVLEEGRPGHFGLSSMRERAIIAGGKLDASSAIGSGTEIRLVIPASRAYAASTSRREAATAP